MASVVIALDGSTDGFGGRFTRRRRARSALPGGGRAPALCPRIRAERLLGRVARGKGPAYRTRLYRPGSNACGADRRPSASEGHRSVFAIASAVVAMTVPDPAQLFGDAVSGLGAVAPFVIIAMGSGATCALSCLRSWRRRAGPCPGGRSRPWSRSRWRDDRPLAFAFVRVAGRGVPARSRGWIPASRCGRASLTHRNPVSAHRPCVSRDVTNCRAGLDRRSRTTPRRCPGIPAAPVPLHRARHPSSGVRLTGPEAIATSPAKPTDRPPRRPA